MPSFQADGMHPDLHTWMNSECRALETGPIAHFSSSGGMPSGPAARPFLSFEMACATSSRVGSSTEMWGSVVASSASASKAVEGVPSWWFSAASKCSCQRCRDSAWELHGDPSALLMTGVTWADLYPANDLIAVNAGPRWLERIPSSASLASLFRYDSRSSFALALKTDCNPREY